MSSSSGTGMFDNLRDVISLVDRLRDVGIQDYIKMPRIVVVGSQSAGKSSVLENIIGFDCLPRGDGVVTRRPLELRLVHLNPDDYDEATMWATFDVENGNKITENTVEGIRNKISELTDQVAGTRKGIVDIPITLTIHSTASPDLTLIDLPGVTRVPLKDADQTEDIEKITRDMTMKYIHDVNTVILAVIPGNQDLSTSDALMLSRQVDPRGYRTVGVITKLDIMDRGTDATSVLLGQQIELTHGYVGVINRSQEDIKNGLGVAEALVKEGEYFSEHRAYRKLPDSVLGIPSLRAKLSDILYRQIQSFLPKLRNEITLRRQVCRDELDTLGDGVPDDAMGKQAMLMNLLSRYCMCLVSCTSGLFNSERETLLNSNNRAIDDALNVGVALDTLYARFIRTEYNRDMTEAFTDKKIAEKIVTYNGGVNLSFPSPEALVALVKPELQKLRDPCDMAVEQAQTALRDVVSVLASHFFTAYPGLATEVIRLSHEKLTTHHEKCKSLVKDLIEANVSSIYTANMDFIMDAHQVENTRHAGHSQPETMSEMGADIKSKLVSHATTVGKKARGLISAHDTCASRYSDEIRNRLIAYYTLTVSQIQDQVPRLIQAFLVKACMNDLQNYLSTRLAHSGEISNFLSESAQTAKRRKNVNQEKAVLDKAYAVLTSDTKFTSYVSITHDTPPESPVARYKKPEVKSTVAPQQQSQSKTKTQNTQPADPASQSQSTQSVIGGWGQAAWGGVPKREPANSLFE